MTQSVSISGLIDVVTFSDSWTPATLPTLSMELHIVVPASTTDQDISLAGIPNQKVIMIFGATHITARFIATTGEILDATMLCICAEVAMTHTHLYLSNSDSIDHDVTVIVAGLPS